MQVRVRALAWPYPSLVSTGVPSSPRHLLHRHCLPSCPGNVLQSITSSLASILLVGRNYHWDLLIYFLCKVDDLNKCEYIYLITSVHMLVLTFSDTLPAPPTIYNLSFMANIVEKHLGNRKLCISVHLKQCYDLNIYRFNFARYLFLMYKMNFLNR